MRDKHSPWGSVWGGWLVSGLLWCVMASGLPGQPTPYVMPKAEVQTLPHSANGRDYILYVSFPLSYETSGPSRRYPVIYMCDGYWDFPLVAATADYIRRDGMAPESIVVGIGYGGTNPDVGLLRQWDLTPGIDPIYDSTGARTGHAEEFLAVIATEIIPFVESNYRADPTLRVLFGNSFGGLFAVYAAFERPNLFRGVIASGPSLDWRGEFLLDVARAKKASGASMNVRLYLGWAVGDEAGTAGSSRRLAEELFRLGIPGMRVAAREVPGAGHSGAKPENVASGLRFVFSPQAWVRVGGLDPGHGSLGRYVNLSTRGRVSAGENALIGGVVVEGILPKRMLIRAAGPSLGPFGVAEPLANPRFRIVDSSGATVAENDDWGSVADPAATELAASQVGAFPFATGSLDAALVVRLAPGAYTVFVDGAAGTAGVALVEAYELGP